MIAFNKIIAIYSGVVEFIANEIGVEKEIKEVTDKGVQVGPKTGTIDELDTYDKLFDQGYITFNSDKTLKVSPWISPMNQKRLSIFNGKHISMLPLDDARKEYLKYHREHIFKG